MRVTNALIALVAVVIGALMSGSMSFDEIISFIFLMLLALGAYGLVQRMRLKATLAGKGEFEEKAVGKRLKDLEQRLTDVQDVMLAVNDRLERMDGSAHGPGRKTPHACPASITRKPVWGDRLWGT